MAQLNIDPPWGPVSLPETDLPLPDGQNLHFKKIDSRIIITGKDGTEKIIVVPAEQEIHYIPTLPDKPVVIRPSQITYITPHSSLVHTANLPLVPALATQNESGTDKMLLAFPKETLCSTWYGEPDSGEAAYLLDTDLLAQKNSCHTHKWHARCRLRISNTSSEPLHFQKLLVSVEYLSLYTGEQTFHTNDITVKYRGVNQDEYTQISPSVPEVDDNLRLFSGPRSRLNHRILKKSVKIIKFLTYS